METCQAKNVKKFKEEDEATFFSPTDEWSLLAASTIKLDSGASLLKLDTVKVSQNPTVATASSEVQTKEGNSACQRIGFIREQRLQGIDGPVTPITVDIPCSKRARL